MQCVKTHKVVYNLVLLAHKVVLSLSAKCTQGQMT